MLSEDDDSVKSILWTPMIPRKEVGTETPAVAVTVEPRPVVATSVRVSVSRPAALDEAT